MSANDWDPALYTRFEDERTRPARDLLARCVLPGRESGEGLAIADLGCGPGNSTELLERRFPGAEIVGYDNSPAMLETARARVHKARFEMADIGDFRPGRHFDLLYSNAALHWAQNHGALFPALFDHVAPGGLFAVQMPDNLDEPSHRAMAEIATEPEFAPHLRGATDARESLARPQDYYDWLAPAAESVEVWITAYRHPMESADAIAEMLRSTGLKPFLDPLPDDLKRLFLARYVERMEVAYPARVDGRRLLAFPRLFIVARRTNQP